MNYSYQEIVHLLDWVELVLCVLNVLLLESVWERRGVSEGSRG